MKIPVLLVSTATRWIGTARIPAALAHAGFTVALLTPRNSLAEKSRYVSNVGYLPDNATIAQWVAAFAEIVTATQPRLVAALRRHGVPAAGETRADRRRTACRPRSMRGCRR